MCAKKDNITIIFFFQKNIIMHQLVKLTDSIGLVIYSPLIYALGDPSQIPLGFEPRYLAWEAETELSLPLLS